VLEIEVDIGKILRGLWRRGWLVLLAAVFGACGCALGAALWLTPQYTSSAIFYISGNVNAPVDSAIVVLETRQTRREVLLDSGINRSEEEVEEWIHAEPVRTTDFLKVEVTAPDAIEAKVLADSVTRVLPRRMGQIVGDISAMVVDEAALARKPSTFTQKQWAMLGAVVGTLLSAGIIVLVEIFPKKKK